MAVKVKDIAKALCISPATVSLVLNNKPGVKDETRVKVLKYINETGYGINAIVKSGLKKQGILQFMIYIKHGKVVSDTPFFSRLIESIEKEARKGGYQLQITYLSENDISSGAFPLPDMKLPGGIILLATEMSSQELSLFQKSRIPLIVLDNYFENTDVDTVAIDNERGAYLAAQHLIGMGHKKIGYLCSSARINNFEMRKRGLLRALAEHEMKLEDRFVFHLDPSQNGAYRDMKLLLDHQEEWPSAVFADNDLVALGAMKAFRENGISVPEDISVVGFDDMPFCTMIEPALSTIQVRNREMGTVAVRRLIDKIENEDREILKTLVGVKLIKRNSVLKI